MMLGARNAARLAARQKKKYRSGWCQLMLSFRSNSRRHALLASSLELLQARGGSFGFFPGVVGPDELVAPTDAPIIGDVFDSDAFAPGVHFCFFCSVVLRQRAVKTCSAETPQRGLRQLAAPEECAALPSLVSRRKPRAGLVASRQTSVRRRHLRLPDEGGTLGRRRLEISLTASLLAGFALVVASRQILVRRRHPLAEPEPCSAARRQTGNCDDQ